MAAFIQIATSPELDDGGAMPPVRDLAAQAKRVLDRAVAAVAERHLRPLVRSGALVEVHNDCPTRGVDEGDLGGLLPGAETRGVVPDDRRSHVERFETEAAS